MFKDYISHESVLVFFYLTLAFFHATLYDIRHVPRHRFIVIFKKYKKES